MKANNLDYVQKGNIIFTRSYYMSHQIMDMLYSNSIDQFIFVNDMHAILD